MADLGLNEHHQQIVMNYMRFSRYQRSQNLKAIEYSFKDVIDSRLLEDTYTAEEVQEMLIGLCNIVRGDVETELISSSHINVLLLKQLFAQAEKWHLRLQADLSELENREQLESVKALEDSVFACIKPDRVPPSPTKVRLAPLTEGSGPIPLLNLEIERLKEENQKLSDSFNETQAMTNKYQQEITQLKSELSLAHNDISALKEMSDKGPEPSQLNEVESQLDKVRNLLTTNLELSVSTQQQLELELSTTRQEVDQVHAQLQLAEQELERKFSETAAYANMKKMLTKKNEQIKELRNKLLHLHIEGNDGNED